MKRFQPEYPGEYPTLGFIVLDWMSSYLAAPDREAYEPFIPTREQSEFILQLYRLDPVTGRRVYRRGVISRSKGWGKAEHVDAEVPTPTGWARVGDLRAGDAVLGSNGAPVRVLQAHPVIRDQAYRVTLNDGSSSVFHGNHVFLVGEFTGDRRVWRELSVSDMAAAGVKSPRGGAARFALPHTPVLDLPPVELPAPPYALGRRLGLSEARRLPAVYLRASAAQRLELLQGLMDSCGDVEADGRAGIVVTGPRLAGDVMELIRTFGFLVNVRTVGARYRLSFRPPAGVEANRLELHASGAPYRCIRSIELVPECPMRCITVDAEDGLYLTGRTFWVTHNSPLLASLAVTEGLAPVLFDGWDAAGRPVGKPWSRVRTPEVQLLAVSEKQTKNAWRPLLEMVQNGPLMDEYPGLEPMNSKVLLPTGSIEYRTASATTEEGAKPVFAILDQSESWTPSNGGVALAATVRRNAGKIGGVTVEAPNAFEPGAGSVAEASARYWQNIQDGAVKDEGLLYDHRNWPETTDLGDEDSVMEGLAIAYGDSADLPGGCMIHTPPCKPDEWPGGWVDLIRIRQEIWDPDTTVSDAVRYYGNKAHADADALVTEYQWRLREAGENIAPVGPHDPVTLGFDGSRHRKKGVTDATVLIAQRVLDGFSWPVGIWEQPDTAAGRDWEPPEYEIERTLDEFMNTHHVVGFYADPTLWETNVAGWEAKYGDRLKVGPRNHPIVWRTSQGKRVAEAVELLRNGIIDGQIIHNGDSRLTRHILNARLRQRSYGRLMFKEFPDSPRKIDAAYGLMLANLARVDALAHGNLEDKPARPSFVPFRVR